MFGGLCGSLTLSVLVMKWNRGFGAYYLVFLMAFRSMTTFVTLYLIQTKAPGFAQIDRKEFAASIAWIALPAFISACSNLKFHTLVTFPMTCTAIWFSNQQALTTADDNLSCYSRPDNIALNETVRWCINLLAVLGASYFIRKITLERFSEQEKSKKMQDQLQNLFDKQPDGVLILSKSTAIVKLPIRPSTTQQERDSSFSQIYDQNRDNSSIPYMIDATQSRLGSSFPSFVNSIDTMGQEEEANYEMVFHNEALLKIVGIQNTKDLHAFLAKPEFVNREQGTKLSLLTTIQNRYSDYILNQTYKFERKTKPVSSEEQSLNRNETRKNTEPTRIISFLRNEVIFNDKKCIVIRVRDLTDQESLFES